VTYSALKYAKNDELAAIIREQFDQIFNCQDQDRIYEKYLVL
jgi:hypothetical protein